MEIEHQTVAHVVGDNFILSMYICNEQLLTIAVIELLLAPSCRLLLANSCQQVSADTDGATQRAVSRP